VDRAAGARTERNFLSQRGLVLIVSGPSGVGKTTVCRRLAERLDAFLSVSMTTRPARPGEVDGHAYRFVSTEQFERSIEQDKLLEYAQVYGGHYYGTPTEPIRKAIEQGRLAVLDIEIKGTLQVKQRLPEAVAVYLLAPNPAEQRKRLVGRGLDAKEAQAERLGKAEAEIRQARACGAYDAFVVNREVDETVEELVRIVESARDGS
jgi:guanylate kinase